MRCGDCKHWGSDGENAGGRNRRCGRVAYEGSVETVLGVDGLFDGPAGILAEYAIVPSLWAKADYGCVLFEAEEATLVGNV